MSCTRTRLLAAGFVLAVVAAGIGWTLYVRECQRAERERERANSLAAELISADPAEFASVEPDVAAIRKYKKYKEDVKINRAKEEMRLVQIAYKTYYTTHGEWPNNIEQIAEYLEKGQAALIDPWGKPYSMQVHSVQGQDGQEIQRPVVYCQPPDGKPRLQWPENVP